MALILWSGGCDSTYLLCSMLRQRQDGRYAAFSGENGGLILPRSEPIRTLSILHPQMSGSRTMRLARERMLEAITKEFGEFEHNEVEIINHGDAAVPRPGGDGLIQPVTWLANALLYLRRDDDLYAGYIRSDDFWHYHHQFKSATKEFLAISGHKGCFRGPLEWTTKVEVINGLKALNMLDRCWYCEAQDRPIDDGPCGTCCSCKTHALALHELRLEDKRFRAYAAKAKKLVACDGESKKKARRLTPCKPKSIR